VKEAALIRVVTRADNHLLLGIQGVGAGTAELSAGFSLALRWAATRGRRRNDPFSPDSERRSSGERLHALERSHARLVPAASDTPGLFERPRSARCREGMGSHYRTRKMVNR
jgi:hypothetical protein